MASCQIISMPASLSLRHGNGREILPAVALEDVRVLDRDLFQRLQAIGGKSRRDHDQVLHALLGERLHRLDGVGLEPLRAAEARLIRQHQLGVVEPHLLAQQLRRAHALALIGIALVDVVLRHAVIGGDDHVGRKRQRP